MFWQPVWTHALYTARVIEVHLLLELAMFLSVPGPLYVMLILCKITPTSPPSPSSSSDELLVSLQVSVQRPPSRGCTSFPAFSVQHRLFPS